jgi:hypothetical protein
MTTVVRQRKRGMSSAKGIAGFSKTGIKWVRADRGVPDDDLYIRWGWTGNLPNPKAKVLNTAKAIHQVADKLEFRRTLGIGMRLGEATGRHCRLSSEQGLITKVVDCGA